ncbi:MAG: TonB-dependent receptor, partial [Rubricoccaceae bacterium]|nr:TonB-dependent receptor [Rubricoccaceae bacterium]
GNVSLRGVSNVAILINGRPAPVSGDFIASYLQSLPAATIERVEVIPNPSARYEPDGMAGILNIVLKEDVDLGLGGAVTVGGDSQGGVDATGLLTYSKGDLSISSSYGFRRGARDSDGGRFRINRYLNPSTTLEQDFLNEQTGMSHFGSLSADYALSDNSMLTAAAQIGVRGEDSDDLTTFLELDADEDVIQNYDRFSEESEDNWNASARAGFRHDFGTPSNAESRGTEGMGGRGYRRHRGRRDSGGGSGSGLGSHTLNVEADYDRSFEEESELFTEEAAEGTILERQQTINEEMEEEFSLQADYVRPLEFINGTARMELGYRGDIERIESSFFSETFDTDLNEFVPDTDLNNAFDYQRQVHAVYSQFATQIGQLSLQLGLRVESATTVFTLENTGEEFDNDYLSAFPSGFLLYEVGANTAIRTSYSRRVHRPRTWYLNPFPSVSDPLNIRQGNPSLLPEYVDALELGFIHYTDFGSLTFSPYFRRTTDVIRRFQQIREDGVTISTFENLDTNDSYGVELIASLRAGSLRGSASIEGYQVVTDGSNVETELENNAFGWGGRANLNYTIRQGLDAQISFRYRAPMNTEQGRSGSRSHVNLGLRQRFLDDRASLSLRVRDPFDTSGFSSILDQPDLYQEFDRSWGGREIGLTFTYAFGKQERDERRQDGPGMDTGGEFDEISLDG